MKNHLARRGGIWWARLVVPKRLRPAAGRCEFIQSTRTHELHVAKLVAAVMVADWRRQLMRLESRSMNPNVLKLLEPALALAIGGTITIDEAVQLGLARVQLLRVAAAGRLVLHCRLAGNHGVLVDMSELDLDAETGGRDIPPAGYMPASAVDTVQTGVFAIPHCAALASVVLDDGSDVMNVVALESAASRERWFVPTTPITVEVGRLEVSASAVAAIRGHILGRLTPAEVAQAGEYQKLTVRASVHTSANPNSGKRADALFSQALDAYCTDPSGLPHDLTSAIEQRQRRAGMALFAEFMGDLPLRDIDSDKLREFRDGPLRTLPANANHLTKELRCPTMKETIQAIRQAGVEWPFMSANMQAERMQWLARLFGWLYKKEWIAASPSAPLDGETGLTKADRKEKQRASGLEDETGREPFGQDDLKRIFGQSWFATGSGAHFKKPRYWYPFEYWLPLLGLFAGCRIQEASQLHLTDVKLEDGISVLDLNENTADKSLKNTGRSRRQIPLHPRLIELGFLAYCERVKAEGFQRVFPELTWAKSDARYAKETGRKMSKMLENLGMPRNGLKVFHCLRHNLNNALARVPLHVLPNADQNLRKFIRYTVIGHQLGDDDVNIKHYMTTPMSERLALVSSVEYDLPEIANIDIEFAIFQVHKALANKEGNRRGREDMGPLNRERYESSTRSV